MNDHEYLSLTDLGKRFGVTEMLMCSYMNDAPVASGTAAILFAGIFRSKFTSA